MNEYQKNKSDLLLALNHALKGGKFEYTSFDYKKALADYQQTDEFAEIQNSFSFFSTTYIPDKYQIPIEIRERYAVKRIGKLREAEFLPNGDIRRLKIGSKYAISFYNISDLKFI